MKKSKETCEQIYKAWDLRHKYIDLHKQPKKQAQPYSNQLLQDFQDYLTVKYSDTRFDVNYSKITCDAHNCGSVISVICNDGIRRLYKVYIDFESQTVYWCFS
jgi:hypothetical protein